MRLLAKRGRRPPRGALPQGCFRDKVQPYAVIVNSARSFFIDQADTAAALKSGTIAGAALDVFRAEPLPVDSPLRDAPNLLLTPHAAWYSEASIDRVPGLLAEDIARALRGESPRKPVRA